jgi:hypothetical protein
MSDPSTDQLRAIQDQVRESDRLRPPLEMDRAMQAGAREYPEPPFPGRGAVQARD